MAQKIKYDIVFRDIYVKHCDNNDVIRETNEYKRMRKIECPICGQTPVITCTNSKELPEYSRKIIVQCSCVFLTAFFNDDKLSEVMREMEKRWRKTTLNAIYGTRYIDERQRQRRKKINTPFPRIIEPSLTELYDFALKYPDMACNIIDGKLKIQYNQPNAMIDNHD